MKKQIILFIIGLFVFIFILYSDTVNIKSLRKRIDGLYNYEGKKMDYQLKGMEMIK